MRLLKDPSAGSCFPYKWGAIVPQSLLFAGQSVFSVSGLYLGVQLIHSHDVNLFNGHLAENVPRKLIFWSFKCIWQGDPPPPLPSLSVPQPPADTRSFPWLILDMQTLHVRGSLSEQITRQTNVVITERIYSFFSVSSATVASRDPLPAFQFKRERFQSGAGAKCCGGEEGVCECV